MCPSRNSPLQVCTALHTCRGPPGWAHHRRTRRTGFALGPPRISQMSSLRETPVSPSCRCVGWGEGLLLQVAAAPRGASARSGPRPASPSRPSSPRSGQQVLRLEMCPLTLRAGPVPPGIGPQNLQLEMSLQRNKKEMSLEMILSHFENEERGPERGRDALAVTRPMAAVSGQGARLPSPWACGWEHRWLQRRFQGRLGGSAGQCPPAALGAVTPGPGVLMGLPASLSAPALCRALSQSLTNL